MKGFMERIRKINVKIRERRDGNYQSSCGKMHLNARNNNYTIKGFAV